LVWPKKTSPATTTSTVFGGDYLNRVSDYYSNIDVAAADATLQPKIATVTRFKNQMLRYRNPADNNDFGFDVPAITEQHWIQFPLLPASKVTDEMVTRTYIQSLEGKVVDTNLNTVTESGAAQGSILKYTVTGTKFRPFARGAANDVMLTNPGNTDIIWGKVGDSMISAHTTTKIAVMSKSLLNSQIMYNDEDGMFGSHYFDMGQMATPPAPPSGERRFYVNQATGEASVITSAGLVLSLEAQGTGGGGGTGVDEEVILREAGAIVGSGSGHKINFLIGSQFDISEDLADDEYEIKIADNAIIDALIGPHTTSKITTLSKSLLNTNIVYGDQNNNLGSFYFDMTQIAAPATPAAGTRRFYVDSGTGKASIKDSSGNTISLEEVGGGGGSAGGMSAGGTATGSGNGTSTTFTIAHGMGAPPEVFFADPASVDALGFYTRTADATNIILTYQIAPPTGSAGNLSYKWGAGMLAAALTPLSPTSSHTMLNKTYQDALFSTYIDMIEQPTDPANPNVNILRMYPKTIDASNVGWYAKVEQNGAIETVRMI
jgi:hypothetical protein